MVLFRQINKMAQRSLGNVAILGAAGGIGQPLSLLMKLSPLVKNLHLYDLHSMPGLAADLDHIDTPAKVKGFNKDDNPIEQALKDVDLILIPAGVPRRLGMTRDSLFNTNAKVVVTLTEHCAKFAPNAWIAVISNPINSTVPIAAEVYKQRGVYNPKTMFGITTLDNVRAQRFVGEALGDVETPRIVPCIGGHSGKTIIPIYSQAEPALDFNDKHAAEITERVREAGNVVLKAKIGGGSACMSMATSAAKFAGSLLKAQAGTEVVDYSYVKCDVTDSPYFNTKITIGQDGVKECHTLALTETEKQMVEEAIPSLIKTIERGEDYVKSHYKMTQIA